MDRDDIWYEQLARQMETDKGPGSWPSLDDDVCSLNECECEECENVHQHSRQHRGNSSDSKDNQTEFGKKNVFTRLGVKGGDITPDDCGRERGRGPRVNTGKGRGSGRDVHVEHINSQNRGNDNWDDGRENTNRNLPSRRYDASKTTRDSKSFKSSPNRRSTINYMDIEPESSISNFESSIEIGTNKGLQLPDIKVIPIAIEGRGMDSYNDRKGDNRYIRNGDPPARDIRQDCHRNRASILLENGMPVDERHDRGRGRDAHDRRRRSTTINAKDDGGRGRKRSRSRNRRSMSPSPKYSRSEHKQESRDKRYSRKEPRSPTTRHNRWNSSESGTRRPEFGNRRGSRKVDDFHRSNDNNKHIHRNDRYTIEKGRRHEDRLKNENDDHHHGTLHHDRRQLYEYGTNGLAMDEEHTQEDEYRSRRSISRSPSANRLSTYTRGVYMNARSEEEHDRDSNADLYSTYTIERDTMKDEELRQSYSRYSQHNSEAEYHSDEIMGCTSPVNGEGNDQRTSMATASSYDWNDEEGDDKTHILYRTNTRSGIAMPRQTSDPYNESDVLSDVVAIVLKLHNNLAVQTLLERIKGQYPHMKKGELFSALEERPDVFSCTEDFHVVAFESEHRKLNDVFVNVHNNIKRCTRRTCKRDCGNFHICKYYLMGKCNVKKCKYNHDLFTIKNRKVLCDHLLQMLDEATLQTFLQEESQHQQERLSCVTPTLCRYYNTKPACNNGEHCHFVHLCKYYVRGECKFSDCKRSHDIRNGQPATVLRKYGLDPESDPVQIFELLSENENVSQGQGGRLLSRTIRPIPTPARTLVEIDTQDMPTMDKNKHENVPTTSEEPINDGEATDENPKEHLSPDQGKNGITQYNVLFGALKKLRRENKLKSTKDVSLGATCNRNNPVLGISNFIAFETSDDDTDVTSQRTSAKKPDTFGGQTIQSKTDKDKLILSDDSPNCFQEMQVLHDHSYLASSTLAELESKEEHCIEGLNLCLKKGTPSSPDMDRRITTFNSHPDEEIPSETGSYCTQEFNIEGCQEHDSYSKTNIINNANEALENQDPFLDEANHDFEKETGIWVSLQQEIVTEPIEEDGFLAETNNATMEESGSLISETIPDSIEEPQLQYAQRDAHCSFSEGSTMSNSVEGHIDMADGMDTYSCLNPEEGSDTKTWTMECCNENAHSGKSALFIQALDAFLRSYSSAQQDVYINNTRVKFEILSASAKIMDGDTIGHSAFFTRTDKQ